ncbi:MAG: peptidase domain protein, partial [Bacteroidetes bacterium]|nr:peptidase domain protein [Bacteroidota bacterium]
MPTTSKTASRSYAHTPDSHYQKSTLDNGVRVVSESIPYVRSVSLGIWADVGSRDESPEQNGISHFLEHMVFKGTKKRSVKEIAQSLESLGGYLNAFTTKEQTCFYARVLDTHVPQSMDVLSDLLLNATFRRHELEKEKLVVIEELKNAEDDPEDIIHDYFEKALFPNHSLGYPIIGTEENLRRFGREDLQAHVAAHYHPSRIVVAAAGNVDHKALVKLAGRYFKRYSTASGMYSRLPGPPDAHKGRELEYPKSIKQAHICLGTVGYSIRHPDRYPLLVLNGLLGEGMSSRLYQVIREKHGFAYSVYSFVTMLSDTGVFGAYIGTDTKKISPAIELVYKELALLKAKPVSKGELERTKSQIKGNLMLGLENMSGRMMRLGSGELYYGSHIPLDSVLRKIDAVTPESIRKVANDLFHRENFSTVVVRPA